MLIGGGAREELAPPLLFVFEPVRRSGPSRSISPLVVPHVLVALPLRSAVVLRVPVAAAELCSLAFVVLPAELSDALRLSRRGHDRGHYVWISILCAFFQACVYLDATRRGWGRQRFDAPRMRYVLAKFSGFESAFLGFCRRTRSTLFRRIPDTPTGPTIRSPVRPPLAVPGAVRSGRDPGQLVSKADVLRTVQQARSASLAFRPRSDPSFRV